VHQDMTGNSECRSVHELWRRGRRRWGRGEGGQAIRAASAATISFLKLPSLTLVLILSITWLVLVMAGLLLVAACGDANTRFMEVHWEGGVTRSCA